MQVHYPSGHVVEWDDTLQVGELITAHDPGYHIVTGFEFRDGHPPLVNHVRVVRADGTKVNTLGMTRTCDASYVQRVTVESVLRAFTEEHNAAVLRRDTLLNYLPVASR